jgi:hypothetical protein
MITVTNAHPRFSVPHDRLFLDALERDLKREKMGLEPTTQVSLSFVDFLIPHSLTFALDYR